MSRTKTHEIPEYSYNLPRYVAHTPWIDFLFSIHCTHDLIVADLLNIRNNNLNDTFRFYPQKIKQIQQFYTFALDLDGYYWFKKIEYPHWNQIYI